MKTRLWEAAKPRMPAPTEQGAIAEPDRSTAQYTREEAAEISKIARAVRTEPRDAMWAASTERKIQEGVEFSPLVKVQKSGIVCGSTSCAVDLRVDGAASDFNKQAALETIERQSLPDGGTGSLFTSRMFCERQADGSFVIHALLLRS